MIKILQVCVPAIGLALVANVGCSAAAGEGDSYSTESPAPSGPEETATTSEPLVVNTAQTWSVGQAPITLASAKSAFCFLTRVSGYFQKSSDYVQVYIDPGTNNWILHGAGTSPNGLLARADCVPLGMNGDKLSISGQFTVVGKSGTIGTGGLKEACFVTGMLGVFQGSADVRASLSGSTWTLSATSGITTSAYCLSGIKGIEDFSWFQGDGLQEGAPDANWACGISEMRGQYHGTGEDIEIDDNSFFGEWDLTGTSKQVNVGLTANCFE
jgi:hypothetical protein